MEPAVLPQASAETVACAAPRPLRDVAASPALFTEELPWLSASDREWVMGRGVCEWLGWPLSG